VYTAADGITAALLGVLVILLATIGVRAWRRSRISPDEKERRRRLMLLSAGKLGDANLLEIHDGLLVYSYAVRGVEYTASQDVSKLKAVCAGRHSFPRAYLCKVRSAKPGQFHRAGGRMERAAAVP
jgi:hypothetical protein